MDTQENDIELSPEELERLQEDELYIRIAFEDNRWLAAVLEIERLRGEMIQLMRRMNALMDEKAELAKECQRLKRLNSRQLRPNRSTETVHGRPF